MADESKKDSAPAEESSAEQQDASATARGSGAKSSTGLDDIFGVSSSKRVKKEAPPAAEDAGAAGEDAAEDQQEKAVDKAPQKTPQPAKAERKEKKPASTASVGGVFKTGAGADDIDLSSDYLDEDDLGGHKKKMNPTTVGLIGVIVVLVVALGAVTMGGSSGLGGDLKALARGEYREKKLAEVAQQEADFAAEQLARMEKYGTLNISGSPLYATIRFNGQLYYGQTSSGAWREMQITSAGGELFRNLKIKQNLTVEVSAPGFKTEREELTEGKWDKSDSSFDFSKQLVFNLLPESAQRQLEFEQRMDTSRVDEDHYGTVSITSVPSGATIIFNKHPLVDKSGAPLVTPVTFSKYYVKNEQTGKLDEKLINVDTPPDVGHTIELSIPEEKGKYPAYVKALDRRMWTCAWKDGQPPETPAKGKTYRDYCDYKFEQQMDFEALKTYIERRDAEIERVKAENEKLQAALEEGGAEGAAKE